ncbi:MAG: hypothetical protein HY540_07355 [Deltaproteobacteria bacterium]|nr:hypothetical protein [Deltaproteobacteria bacterium]
MATQTVLRGSFVFIVGLVVGILMLMLLNEVPPMLRDYTGIRSYATIEEMRHALKLQHFLLPSYFPKHLQWPPSEIFAQVQPAMVLMHFREQKNGQLALAMIVTDRNRTTLPPTRLRPEKLLGREKMPFQAGMAEVSYLLCLGGQHCVQIDWSDKQFRYSLQGTQTVHELLAIAHSMVPLTSAPSTTLNSEK